MVDRVHAKGAKIFVQLWHMSRQGHSSFNTQNELVSAMCLKIAHAKNSKGKYVPYETPRALYTNEIPLIAEDSHESAGLAKCTDFNGIQLHSADGYLFDQFFQSTTNKCMDLYDGSLENCVQFLFVVLDEVKKVRPASRIAVRLSLNGSFASIGGEDNAEFFTHLMKRLSTVGLAFVEILDGFVFGYRDNEKAFKDIVLASGN